MPTLGDGRFSFTIESKDLARGLRTTKRNPRNSKFLTKCEGAVGYDNVLQVLTEINAEPVAIPAQAIIDGFPWPQLFVFTNLIIVCAKTEIYELVGGILVPALMALTAGIEWTAVDFYDYIYMSNGKIAVLRTGTGAWSITTSLPITTTICNFNGQVVIGAPDVEQT